MPIWRADFVLEACLMKSNRHQDSLFFNHAFNVIEIIPSRQKVPISKKQLNCCYAIRIIFLELIVFLTPSVHFLKRLQSFFHGHNFYLA
jgi:hypothetical protein